MANVIMLRRGAMKRRFCYEGSSLLHGTKALVKEASHSAQPFFPPLLFTSHCEDTVSLLSRRCRKKKAPSWKQRWTPHQTLNLAISLIVDFQLAEL